jgi:putative transposase
VKTALGTIFREIAAQSGMELIELRIQPDHWHLCVSFPPALSIANAVKLLKGISARRLRTMFPGLRRQTRADRLWAPSYYVGTAGQVSAETIPRYIASQDTHHAE